MALALHFHWSVLAGTDISVATYTDDRLLDVDGLMDCLSDAEVDTARQLSDPVEQRHFIMRRCFQRVFLKHMLSWDGPLQAIAVEHSVDSRPICRSMPNCRLSFSSSGLTAVACASMTRNVGIDIERVRVVENVGALAKRFFLSHEADWIAALPPSEQDLTFLRYWTVKEAGLKAIGKGIVSGLNRFSLRQNGPTHVVEMYGQSKASPNWEVVFPPLVPAHIVAIIHSQET